MGTVLAMKKWTILVALLGVLTACVGSDGSEKTLSDRFTYSSKPGFDHRNTLDAANALAQSGAPALSIRVDKRAVNGVLFLQEDSRGYQSFLSADNSMVVLKNGVLSATRGLGWDLISSDVAALHVALQSANTTQPYSRTYHHLDGEDQVTATVVSCDLSRRGERSLMVDDRSMSTQLFQEKCVNTDHAFQNLYWVADNKIIQSRQWAGSGIGAIAMRQFD